MGDAPMQEDPISLLYLIKQCPAASRAGASRNWVRIVTLARCRVASARSPDRCLAGSRDCSPATTRTGEPAAVSPPRARLTGRFGSSHRATSPCHDRQRHHRCLRHPPPAGALDRLAAKRLTARTASVKSRNPTRSGPSCSWQVRSASRHRPPAGLGTRPVGSTASSGVSKDRLHGSVEQEPGALATGPGWIVPRVPSGVLSGEPSAPVR